MTVQVSFRRLGPSNSNSSILCQLPRSNLLAATGMASGCLDITTLRKEKYEMLTVLDVSQKSSKLIHVFSTKPDELRFTAKHDKNGMLLTF